MVYNHERIHWLQQKRVVFTYGKKGLWQEMRIRPLVREAPRFCAFWGIEAVTLWPFILVARREERLLSHEMVHWRQIPRWGILPWYIAYVLCFAWGFLQRLSPGELWRRRRIKGSVGAYLSRVSFVAYMNIPFEVEAYTQEG